jgi:beta-glucanase (GH16 family)
MNIQIHSGLVFSGRAFLALFFLSSVQPVYAKNSQQQSLPPPGYTLSFEDNFNGTALDAKKWNYRLSGVCIPENVAVSNGFLRLAECKGKNDKPVFTGGGIITRKTFSYGYYETRAKLPDIEGFHPAFWTSAWDGQEPKPEGFRKMPRIEIDFFENDGRPYFTYGVIRWYPLPRAEFGHTKVPCEEVANEFHVWGCEFTPDEMKFYFDGVLMKTVDVKDLPHNPQYVYLSVIASKPQFIDAAKPAGYVYGTVEYDYFRFYTKDGRYGK